MDQRRPERRRKGLSRQASDVRDGGQLSLRARLGLQAGDVALHRRSRPGRRQPQRDPGPFDCLRPCTHTGPLQSRRHRQDHGAHACGGHGHPDPAPAPVAGRDGRCRPAARRRAGRGLRHLGHARRHAELPARALRYRHGGGEDPQRRTTRSSLAAPERGAVNHGDPGSRKRHRARWLHHRRPSAQGRHGPPLRRHASRARHPDAHEGAGSA